MAAPAVFAVTGAWLLLSPPASWGWASWGWASTIFGWLLVGLNGCLLLILARQARLPRVGYRDGQVCFYLRADGPIAVPLDVVEGFLMGQGPALLPGQRHADDQTVTVVVRLAEKAETWRHREVNRTLGHWCDSYITIRGTWCEPLDEAVVQRMNRQLAQAKRSMILEQPA